jgi:hypothetical protein
MTSLSNMRHAIALVVVLVLGLGAYMLATRVDFFSGVDNRAVTIEREVARLELELLAPLNQLNAVVLDDAIFNSREFRALRDKSVPLTEPALERSNPFAPL